ncbi:hypothetical protein cypCar_00001894, partial [Cyprinus carpio]
LVVCVCVSPSHLRVSSAGSIVVDGHELRLMYSLAQSSGTPSQYEAHSDAQVLVLLDVSPDQSMLDEGVARETCGVRVTWSRRMRPLCITAVSRRRNTWIKSSKHTQTSSSALATTKAPLKPYPVAQNE